MGYKGWQVGDRRGGEESVRENRGMVVDKTAAAWILQGALERLRNLPTAEARGE